MKGFSNRLRGSSGGHPPLRSASSTGSFPVPEQKKQKKQKGVSVSATEKGGKMSRPNMQPENEARIVCHDDLKNNNRNYPSKRDMNNIVRQIQKLNCVAPMICTKPSKYRRQKDDLESKDDCDYERKNYIDYFNSISYNDTHCDSFSHAVVLETAPPSASTRTLVDGCNNTKTPHSNIFLLSTSKSYDEMDKTQSISSFSNYEEDNHHNCSNHYEGGTEYGQAASIHTDFDSMTEKDVATAGSPVIGRGRSHGMDEANDIHSSRLLDLNVCDDQFYATKSNIELDSYLLFDNIVFPSAEGAADSAMFDAEPSIPAVLNKSDLHTGLAPSRDRSLSSEIGDSDPVKVVPPIVDLDCTLSAIEVKSSIDEDEIDNPDNIYYTYSPANSIGQVKDGDYSMKVFSPSSQIIMNGHYIKQREICEEEEEKKDEGTSIQDIVADLQRLEAQEFFSRTSLFEASRIHEATLLKNEDTAATIELEEETLSASGHEEAFMSPDVNINCDYCDMTNHKKTISTELLQKPEPLWSSDESSTAKSLQSSRGKKLIAESEMISFDDLLLIPDPPKIRKLATASQNSISPPPYCKIESASVGNTPGSSTFCSCTKRKASNEHIKPLIDMFESSTNRDSSKVALVDAGVENSKKRISRNNLTVRTPSQGFFWRSHPLQPPKTHLRQSANEIEKIRRLCHARSKSQ